MSDSAITMDIFDDILNSLDKSNKDWNPKRYKYLVLMGRIFKFNQYECFVSLHIQPESWHRTSQDHMHEFRKRGYKSFGINKF